MLSGHFVFQMDISHKFFYTVLGIFGPLPEAEMGPINSPPFVRPFVRPSICPSVTLFLENRALDLSDFWHKVV